MVVATQLEIRVWLHFRKRCEKEYSRRNGMEDSDVLHGSTTDGSLCAEFFVSSFLI